MMQYKKALLIVVLVILFVISGCVSKLKVTHTKFTLNREIHVPMFHVYEAVEELPFEQPVIPVQPKEPQPPPLPDRLVVKISPREVAYTYKKYPDVKPDISTRFKGFQKFPADLHVTYIEELGRTDSNKWLYAVHLEKPQPVKTIQKRLEGSPFSLKRVKKEVDEPSFLAESVSAILVESDLPGVAGVVDTIPRYKYPQLKPKSSLNELFNELQVLSIRRVFRMTEVADEKGIIHVKPIVKLLKESKEKYPLRAARGYRDVSIPTNMENWFLLRLGPKVDLDDAYAMLKKHHFIQAVSYDYAVSPHQEPYEEPRFPDQTELAPATSFGVEVFDPQRIAGIDVDDAWKVTEDNPVVTVAVIGSGIQKNLDEFSGRLWTNTDEVSDGTDTDSNGYIDDIMGITTDDLAFASGTSGTFVPSSEHETKVAAVIAAHATNDTQITGVMGKAQVALMDIKLGYGTYGSCVEVAEAIMYATVNGADIVNMSFGAPGTFEVWEAIQAAVTRDGGGVTLLASAGNSKRRATQDYIGHGAQCPSCFHHVIAVGGLDQNGHLWGHVTPAPDPNAGSNYGVHIDLVAPAADLETITYSTDSQVVSEPTTMSGTSGSAAMVSGIAALLFGKYPTTRLERMRLWLRATAWDIEDPLNDGSTLTGDDIYTGAGLANAKLAITQGQPDPILVGVYVERISDSWNYTSKMENLVGAGRPVIAVQVEGPLADPTGTGPGRWQLHYGLGDDPSTWIEIPVDEAVTSNSNMTYSIDRVNDAYGGYLSYTNSVPVVNASGENPLNTDDLQNEQVYTIRLTAQDAEGRTYTAKDWFMPMRAMILHPPENQPITTRWGWPQIDGFADSRAGATFDMQVLLGGAPNPNWTLTGRTHLYEGMNRSTNVGAFVVPEHSGKSWSPSVPLTDYPMFAAPPSGEGDAIIRLESHHPDGRSTVDIRNVYIDSSSFPASSGSPIEIPSLIEGLSYNFLNKGIKVADVDGAGTRMVFVQYQRRFLAIDLGTGNIAWELIGLDNEQDFTREDVLNGPVFLVEDLDNNGEKEVVVSGFRYGYGDAQTGTVEIHLLKAIDGTPYNTNWDSPFTYVYSSYDGNSVRKIHAADMNNDGVQEIIFYQPAVASGSPVPETEVPSAERGFGKIHVIDIATAQSLDSNYWPHLMPLKYAQLQIGKLDGGIFNQILVANTLEVFDRLANPVAFWNPPADAQKGQARMLQLNFNPQLEVVTFGTRYAGSGGEYVYWIDAMAYYGSRLAGAWPVDLGTINPTFNFQDNAYVKVTDIVSGGFKELVIATNKLQALNIDGSPVAGFTEVDLGGTAAGLEIMDIDDDGEKEILVLVCHIEEIKGYWAPSYFNLCAYEKNGTPLSATDNRWPIRIAADVYTLETSIGTTVTLPDLNNDGRPELLLNVMRDTPYQHHNIRKTYGPRDGLIDILELQ